MVSHRCAAITCCGVSEAPQARDPLAFRPEWLRGGPSALRRGSVPFESLSHPFRQSASGCLALRLRQVVHCIPSTLALRFSIRIAHSSVPPNLASSVRKDLCSSLHVSCTADRSQFAQCVG